MAAMQTRDQILRELKGGQWVSGEELSNMLGISRAAVAKHIAALKKEGYRIEAASRRGYSLQAAPDRLLAVEVRDGLMSSIMGWQEFEHHDLIGSTNVRARELAAQGAVEGTLVVAEEQSAGKGRRGRSWLSGHAEGVCMSLVLRPVIPASEVSRITMVAAVAVAEALIELTGLEIDIKWPNDLLVGGRKLVGILTEASMDMDSVEYVVVGMGINVNSKNFEGEIEAIATSLRRETGQVWDRCVVARKVLEKFEFYYDTLQRVGFDPIISQWKNRSSIIGRRVAVELLDRRIEGTVHDVDADGVLLLDCGEPELQRVLSGDVIPLD